jgi:hypothetical protein
MSFRSTLPPIDRPAALSASPALAMTFALAFALALGACDRGQRSLTLEPRLVPKSSQKVAAATPSGDAATTEAGLAWTLPTGWSVGPERPMRVASLVVDGQSGVDVSLIVLAGEAGGKAANIRRWHGQMGAPAPSDDAIAKLPTIKILGQNGPLVDIRGAFGGGMSGQGAIQDAALIGAICELPGRTAFVKMIGPAAAVQAQRDAFVRFCQSLRQK